MIAIVDYGAGNLLSVKKALDFIGAESVITASANEIKNADGVILPGVGSFGNAMESMHESGLVEAVRSVAQSGRPFLGICLGLQLLFESSEESPGVEGLGVLKGKILKIPSDNLKVPHMGWNSLKFKKSTPLFEGISDGAYVYFVHSYYLSAENISDVSSTTEYGVTIHASVANGNLFATQFHPEKSGDVGLQMLRNFVSLCGGDN
ncbi:MAG: imidazole glycerol phosphate synthase subunit HisH [Clostridia bacterium]|nr:imidazole glycerol phosphate synthase subunit HisH [Clostridia bacterium]